MKKRDKIIYWIATVWLCLGMVSTAIIQLFRIQADGPGTEENLTHLGYPAYILTLLGIWKILGVIAFLIPKFPLLKEWAYAGIFFTVTGALYSHIASGDTFNLILPSLLYLVLIAISWYFRPSDRKIILITNKL
ncbi:DoxX family protein [Parapedobacter lycopersici]|uniref:DoxX family protein n=1 Tax=Parapedobacter lycopersici TaxID=1864939 RepID=UPI0033425385